MRIDACLWQVVPRNYFIAEYCWWSFSSQPDNINRIVESAFSAIVNRNQFISLFVVYIT